MAVLPFGDLPYAREGRGEMSGLGITYLMVVADGDSIPVSLFNG